MKSSLRGIQNEITLAVGTNSSHIVELVDVAVGMVLSFSPQIRNDFV